MATTQTTTAHGKRRARARQENMTLKLVSGVNGWIVEGDSGTAHVVSVEDERATNCTCPDATHRGATCKHQIAVNEWTIDRLVRSGGNALTL